MTNIRLLPVVVLAIAALLVLKTMGLVTNGGYVLTGVGAAQAAGATSGGSEAGTTEADLTVTPAGEPTMEDTSPTLSDTAPTLGAQPEAGGGGHGAPAAEEGEAAAPAETPVDAPHEAPADPGPANAVAAAMARDTYCVESDASITESGEVVLQGAAAQASEGHGESAEPAAESHEPAVPDGSFPPLPAADCLPSGDAVPMEVVAGGTIEPLAGAEGTSATEQQLLERLAARRLELGPTSGEARQQGLLGGR